jgi:transcriptional regulator with XRE-family HTH domain
MNTQALFGKNLKRLRTNAHLSQMDLAGETDISQNFINDIENGKKFVSAETIDKLAEALDVELYQFFINEAQLNEKEKNNIKFYLDDITDNLTKMVKEYRNSYHTESTEDEKK